MHFIKLGPSDLKAFLGCGWVAAICFYVYLRVLELAAFAWVCLDRLRSKC